MKLLLFSDLHGDIEAARHLVQRSRDFDACVGAGDFCNAHRGLESCIRILREIEVPTVLIPGNNETFDELKAACGGWKDVHVLHGTGATIDGITFFGLGGGVPITPFGAWSYDFGEEDARQLLRDCPARAVLVSHSPPQGVVDLSSNARHLGSLAVRETISQQQPQLVACGHIHASAGPRGVEWTLL